MKNKIQKNIFMLYINNPKLRWLLKHFILDDSFSSKSNNDLETFDVMLHNAFESAIIEEVIFIEDYDVFIPIKTPKFTERKLCLEEWFLKHKISSQHTPVIYAIQIATKHIDKNFKFSYYGITLPKLISNKVYK